MAKMHPDDIEDYGKATRGEKKVFRFLMEAARPHKDFICFYEPPIGSTGKVPDFILFGKKLGLVILEVKDWSLSRIITATPFKFTIQVTGKKKTVGNPDKQAKGYVDALMEKLKEVGQLKIPIGRMVVFPNIERDGYLKRNLQWIIPPERALFRDDLEATGEILCDTSGRKFQERISGSLPFKFKGLTHKEIEKLSFVIRPELQMDLPLRQGSGKSRFRKEVHALDEDQGRLALRFGRGHQIIKGPPGSGKTLVLIHRCCHLSKYHPQVKKILLVCYNIALVSYLKRLIQDKGLGVGESGILVCHFFELCSRILEEPVHYENEDPEYYDVVIQEVLARVSEGKSPVGPFDAIFVDEGQDFSSEMLKTLMGLLKAKGDLVISLDSYQDLYRRRTSWKSLGIKASGRTRHLKRVYRNTVEIFDFTQRFLGVKPKPKQQLSLLPDNFAFHGGLPEMHYFQVFEEIEDFLIRDLIECISRGDYKRSEIAVIYDDKVYGLERFAYDNRALPMRILKKLEVSGIPAIWVSQDVRAKEMYDVTTDRVSLISIHSSKGLDFDLVYLMGMDHIQTAGQTRKNLTSLIYVAMTRAKYRLVIPYVKETEFIKRMKSCLPDN